jgi:hypothetical protein
VVEASILKFQSPMCVPGQLPIRLIGTVSATFLSLMAFECYLSTRPGLLRWILRPSSKIVKHTVTRDRNWGRRPRLYLRSFRQSRLQQKQENRSKEHKQGSDRIPAYGHCLKILSSFPNLSRGLSESGTQRETSFARGWGFVSTRKSCTLNPYEEHYLECR